MPMKEFLFILRDHEQRWEHFSPDDFQNVINAYADWNQKLAAEERLVAAGKLTGHGGTTLRRQSSGLVVDGPYSEAKEAIAGYFQVRAENLEEANRLAGDCPILDYGGSVEVREMVGTEDDRSCELD